MNNQQMVAMIQTILYFIGKQTYTPAAADVAAYLNEAISGQSQAPSPGKTSPPGWDIGKNKPV